MLIHGCSQARFGGGDSGERGRETPQENWTMTPLNFYWDLNILRKQIVKGLGGKCLPFTIIPLCLLWTVFKYYIFNY
mgnify:FL=1